METQAAPDGTGRGAPARAVRRGSSVGRYLVLDVVGSGGMGVVHAAYDPELDRRVAIKLLRPRSGETEFVSERAADLLREGRAVAKLSHPNVISVFDVGRHGQELFIAMEFIDGKTVAQWLLDAKPAPSEILRAFASAGRGLIAAHDAALVHGDFKPRNVMITPAGRVVVLDFGLARSSQDRTKRQDGPPTESDAVAGTPAYMAPELHAGSTPNPTSDQFAYCISLYQALCGEHPFTGKQAIEIAQSVINDPPREPRPDVISPHLWSVLRRGLSKKPADRHPSMRDLIAALDPPKRWRPPWMLAGALAVGAAAAYSFGEDEPCTQGRAEIAQAWPGTARAELSTAHPDADLGALDAQVDDFTEAWTLTWTNACRATNVEKTQSTELLDRRMVCLRRLKSDLERLLSTAAATEAPLSKLQVGVTEVGSPRSCDSATALLDQPPLPSDPETRAAIEEAIPEAAELQAKLGLRVDLDAAVIAAKGLSERVVALDYPPLEYRVAMIYGALLRETGSRAAAVPHFQRAFFAAERAADEDGAVGAASALVHVHTITHEPKPAALWSELGVAKTARLPSPASAAHLRFLQSRGVALRYAGEAEQSISVLDDALELHRRYIGVTDAHLCDLTHALAGSYRELKDFDRAADLAMDGVRCRQQVLGANHPLVGESLFNLAMIQVNQDNATGAIESLALGREILAGEDPRSRRLIVFDGQTGVAFAQAGDPELGAKYLERGLALARETFPSDDYDFNPLLVNLAKVNLMRGRFDEARSQVEEAIGIAEAAYGVDYPPLAIDLGILADAQAGLGDNAAAIRALERARSLSKSDGQRESFSQRLEKLEADATIGNEE